MHDSRGVNFTQIERDHVQRFYPPFEWHPFDTFSPYLPLAVPLSEARVAFVTTAGVHLPEQPPFDVGSNQGDPSWRAIPVETPLADLRLSHGGYDTNRARADPNVVLPLEHLRAFRDEGRLGALTPNVYSFMGYVADTERLVAVEAPVVAEHLRAERADLVLLAPT